MKRDIENATLRRIIEEQQELADSVSLIHDNAAVMDIFRNNPNGALELYRDGKVTRWVVRHPRQPQPTEGVRLEDFQAYLPDHNYIFMPTREPWPASSVNSQILAMPLLDERGEPILDETGSPKKITATQWLDQNRKVEQMTWAPGRPALIPDRLISEGGWIDRIGMTCLNLYRPPNIEPGDAMQAARWTDHVHKVFSDEAPHIINWLAQRVQHPEIKINHALLLGGPQGIGKDTLLEPVKRAIGPWNFCEVSPPQMLGRFNGFLKSVILRISEARDLGDIDRYKLYDHMKAYTAAPPDVLRVDEKYLREHSVLNCCGVIITTNYKTDGIYLPPDDRRHHVSWSELTKDDFTENYWNELWGWYAAGGDRHVAAYLASFDLSDFDPKAPPPKTEAFWSIVAASQAPEDAELADVLDRIGNPAATTIVRITNETIGPFHEWITDRRNRRSIPHRLERCGYIQFRNSLAKDGLWKIDGARQAVYVQQALNPHDRYAAAQGLLR